LGTKDAATVILGELAAGHRALAHAALDELPDSKPLRHLRSVLVATGALPPRDEHLIRLEQWITVTIGERDDPEQRQLLRRYALGYILHRLRRRNDGKHATHGQSVTVQQHLKAAITMLDWFTAHGRDLASARQGDLDTWLANEHSAHRREAGHFVRWAKRQKLTSLEFAATKWDGPNGVIDTEARWEQARRLLHDDTLKPEDRVAGLLVLLYARGPPRSAASPSTTSMPPTPTYDSDSAASPSSCPSPSPHWSDTSSPPATATPPSATKEARHGCSPADDPDDPSAQPT
jgi:hypothetical protein